MVHRQWPQCSCHSVLCLYKCGVYPLRKNFEDHVKSECSHRTENLEQNIGPALSDDVEIERSCPTEEVEKKNTKPAQVINSMS